MAGERPPRAPSDPATLAPILVLAGPTGTGKTALSVELADLLLARGVVVEIISADSRQVYRGLDIGTAKVGRAERARVVHHGIDLVDPDEPFSVAQFRGHALAALRELGRRGGLGIVVGGTGFWVRSLTAGLDTEALPADPAVRAEVEAAIRRDGAEPAAIRLREIAPRLAAGIDLRNPRRIARALEIALLAGDRTRPEPRGYPAPSLPLLVDVEPVVHRARLLERARAQFDAGLVEEAGSLRERFDPSLPAFSAIGYREAWALLDGDLDREAAIVRDASRNVAFARRQRTWFRRESGERHDLTAGGKELLEPLVDRALRLLEPDRRLPRDAATGPSRGARPEQRTGSSGGPGEPVS